MDNVAEKLAGWFGSVTFILFHVFWFGTWLTLHFRIGFDEDWQNLTLIVSLEAIFLSLFILRAENVQAKRAEEKLRQDLKESKKELEILKKLQKKRSRN